MDWFFHFLVAGARFVRLHSHESLGVHCKYPGVEAKSLSPTPLGKVIVRSDR